MITSQPAHADDLLSPAEPAVDPRGETLAGDPVLALARRKTVGEMLLFPGDRAAGMMTLEVAGLEETETVASAVEMLRDPSQRPPDISQIFVVDGGGVLVGSLSLAQLLFAPPYSRLREAMNPKPAAVTTDAGYEECARLIEDADMRSLPVVDQAGRLQGAIALEDVVRVAEKRAAQDVARLFGLGAEDRALGPFWNSVRSRFPWLLINLATVLLAGLVISVFEPAIDRIALLAVFIPVVLGQSGIAGTQTVTLVVRSLALKEISPADGRRLLAKEGALSLVQGAAISSMLALIVWAWRGDLYLGLVVGTAMVLSLLVAAFGGVMVPLGMKALRIDPAASSAVVVTTLTDTLGILAYLGLATVFLALFRAG